MIQTTDIWLIAWLDEIKGVKFARHKKLDRGKLTFEYDLGQDEWDRLRAEFFHSETARVKAYQHKIKDLFY
jgi:hypothetical protein